MKLLSYLEGELQARDVVIAALKVKTIPHIEMYFFFQSKTFFLLSVGAG